MGSKTIGHTYNDSSRCTIGLLVVNVINLVKDYPKTREALKAQHQSTATSKTKLAEWTHSTPDRHGAGQFFGSASSNSNMLQLVFVSCSSASRWFRSTRNNADRYSRCSARGHQAGEHDHAHAAARSVRAVQDIRHWPMLTAIPTSVKSVKFLVHLALLPRRGDRCYCASWSSGCYFSPR